MHFLCTSFTELRAETFADNILYSLIFYNLNC